MYEYKAVVARLIDGDTIEIDIDLGFRTLLKKERVRLSGVDAPELRGDEREEGLKALACLFELIQLGDKITIKTFLDKREKYGRILAEVYDENGVNINDQMKAKGYEEHK